MSGSGRQLGEGGTDRAADAYQWPTINLVLWVDRFEAQRQVVLSVGMLACHGRVQREGEVVHVVTDHLEDLSPMLASVGELGGTFR